MQRTPGQPGVMQPKPVPSPGGCKFNMEVQGMYLFQAKYWDSKFNKTRKHTIEIEEQFTKDNYDAWCIALRQASHEYLADGTEAPLPAYLQLLEVKFISC